MSYRTLLYEVKDRIATITLNRPERLNAINHELPGELRAAVETADQDDEVHVIILQGAGEAFCSGYDLKQFAERSSGVDLSQEMPWDPMEDYRVMKKWTEDYSTLLRCYTPTIAKVHGYAFAGGSDIALCCDLLVMAEDARIGYPPARVWGVPTTAMWMSRVGPQQAKRMLFTGDLIDGVEAKSIGLALDSVPSGDLDSTVEALAKRIAGVPRNQLMMHKLVVNQALEAQGLLNTQMIATVFDGIARHTPEGLEFQEMAQEKGFHEAVRHRDSGDWISTKKDKSS